MKDCCKCCLEVTAGVIPGKPMPEHTRRWAFSQVDIDEPFVFADAAGAASEYARSLQNPNKVNWVRLDWIWF